MYRYLFGPGTFSFLDFCIAQGTQTKQEKVYSIRAFVDFLLKTALVYTFIPYLETTVLPILHDKT